MSIPRTPSLTHDEVVQRFLRDRPGLAVTYLEVSAEGATDPIGRAVFLIARHAVAKFRGMTEVAEKAGMKVESLSRALSARGNPTLKTLLSINQALGMRIAVVPAEPVPPTAKKRKSPRKSRV